MPSTKNFSLEILRQSHTSLVKTLHGFPPQIHQQYVFPRNFLEEIARDFLYTLSWIEMFSMCCWGMEPNMSTELKRLKTGQIVIVVQVLRGVRVRAEAEEAAGEADHCDRGGFCSHQKDAW